MFLKTVYVDIAIEFISNKNSHVLPVFWNRSLKCCRIYEHQQGSYLEKGLNVIFFFPKTTWKIFWRRTRKGNINWFLISAIITLYFVSFMTSISDRFFWRNTILTNHCLIFYFCFSLLLMLLYSCIICKFFFNETPLNGFNTIDKLSSISDVITNYFFFFYKTMPFFFFIIICIQQEMALARGQK